MKLRLRSAIVASVAATLAIVFAAPAARAQSIIKSPGEHPIYSVEAEPHVIFGGDNAFGSGFGLGGRFSIPIMDPGFVKGINDTIAIGFGLDLFFYGGCYYSNYNCGSTAFLVPVVLQWNFYVAPHVSVFAEPGIGFEHYGYSGCPTGARGCIDFNDNRFLPLVFYAGARYHFTEKVALTGRLGFDNLGAGYLSVGVSFFP